MADMMSFCGYCWTILVEAMRQQLSRQIPTNNTRAHSCASTHERTHEQTNTRTNERCKLCTHTYRQTDRSTDIPCAGRIFPVTSICSLFQHRGFHERPAANTFATKKEKQNWVSPKYCCGRRTCFTTQF